MVHRKIACLLFAFAPILSASAQEKVKLPADEPPQLFIVAAVNKDGLVLQRRYPSTKEVDAPTVIEYKALFKSIQARDAKGKPITAEDILRRVKPGTVVLVSADDQRVDPVFLSEMKDDTLILSGVIPPKGATAATVEE